MERKYIQNFIVEINLFHVVSSLTNARGSIPAIESFENVAADGPVGVQKPKTVHHDFTLMSKNVRCWYWQAVDHRLGTLHLYEAVTLLTVKPKTHALGILQDTFLSATGWVTFHCIRRAIGWWSRR